MRLNNIVKLIISKVKLMIDEQINYNSSLEKSSVIILSSGEVKHPSSSLDISLKSCEIIGYSKIKIRILNK